MYYRSSDSCRVLESISEDPKLSNGVKEGLLSYLNESEVRAFLMRSSGEVFSTSDIGVPFSAMAAFDEYLIDSKDWQLIIKTDSPDKSFRDPYSIKEVGIGFSRAYLMYMNDISSQNEEVGFFSFNLREDSYVNCRVYD